MDKTDTLLNEIIAHLEVGGIVPYLGPGVLDLVPGGSPVPNSPEALVQQLVAKSSVPHKIRGNLTAAAQYIENFKHRKTLVGHMTEAFAPDVPPTFLHHFLAGIARRPLLIVDAWYDNAMATALQSRLQSGQMQGVSQSEHFGTWVHYFRPDGTRTDPFEADTWDTLLYKPMGSIAPTRNFLVSDTDFVEVLTEIDIQTPIPDIVQQLRADRHFLFLGCRFRTQLERTFARQIMKRSSATHWAVLPGELSRNEARFLTEQNIKRIDMPLDAFARLLVGAGQAEKVAAAA
ncbi:MAG: SIR2 family protein [Thiobacillus sp.]|nr:SIR2 family protein [Gammaproteobacteria bacterium]MBU4499036.1 SIR2 family protein [Gammaproteobacteria bacterium]MDO9008249.1 SIR2 family protein [Thiobacillus sp.]